MNTFIELTLTNASENKITINTNHIQHFHTAVPVHYGTVIRMTDGEELPVKETYQEVSEAMK